MKKIKQDPEKLREEVERWGENEDIKAGWSPPDTHVSLPDTHVSLPATHVALPETHVSLRATESSPRAKSQKTGGKIRIFQEIDFP